MAINLMTKIKSILESNDIKTLDKELFTKENNRIDDTILLHIEEILEGTKYKDIKGILGYTEHPSYSESSGWGIMFETSEGENVWCHLSKDAWAI